MRMRVCFLDCHEAGLCCCLVIHIGGNLLRPLQPFYLHLWPIYWLSHVLFWFQLTIRIRGTMTEVSLTTRDFLSVRLPAQTVTCPQKYIRQTVSLYLSVRLSIFSYLSCLSIHPCISVCLSVHQSLQITLKRFLQSIAEIPMETLLLLVLDRMRSLRICTFRNTLLGLVTKK
jgi:hypothetical protein